MAPIDFTNVEEPTGPELLPKGTYRAVITDAEEREVKSGDNRGALAFNIELTMSECINDPERECDGRKVWHFLPVIPPGTKNGKATKGTFPQIKQICRVTGLESEGQFDPQDVDGDNTTFVEYLNGQEVIVKVSIQKGGKNNETGDDYPDRNRVQSYHTEEEFEDSIA